MVSCYAAAAAATVAVASTTTTVATVMLELAIAAAITVAVVLLEVAEPVGEECCLESLSSAIATAAYWSAVAFAGASTATTESVS